MISAGDGTFNGLCIGTGVSSGDGFRIGAGGGTYDGLYIGASARKDVGYSAGVGVVVYYDD